MTRTRILLLAAAVGCLASPALAGSYTPRNPWMETWTCSAYEDAHRCSAIWHPHAARCRCLGIEDMGWRLNEYYGPGSRYLAPRDVQQ